MGSHPCLKKRKQRIYEIIEKERGGNKLFDEWVQVINSQLPTQYRFNGRSLSRILGAMSKKGYFILRKRHGLCCTYYEFVLKGKIKD